jgi:hypothetical protein
MQLNKQRKILLAVLGVALLVFAADWFLAGSSNTGPSVASAEVSAIVAPGSAAPVAEEPDQGPAALTVSVAQQIETFRQRPQLTAVRMADSFEPSAAWIASNQALTQDADEELPQQIAAAFARAHTLSAVMTGTQSSYAVIDGKIVRVGEDLDGFELLLIDDQSVTMSSGKVRVVLRLHD